MTRSQVLLTGIALLATGSFGCSGDPPVVFDAGVPLVDQCLSSSDMAIILASRVDAGAGVDAGAPNPLMDAYYCAMTPTCADLYFNNQNTAAQKCTNDCFVTMPSGGLSTGCRACFTHDALNCAGQFCLLECLAPDPTGCTPCFDMHCQSNLDACIGY